MGKRAVLARALTLGLAAFAGAGRAATLFHEDFDGYTSFPAQDPIGDPINPGLPKQSEGADSKWYGIRFEVPTTGGSLDGDLAVQKQGSSTNLTPVGRVEDEAGIVFEINTVGYSGVTLEFDWRTFQVSGVDRLRAGYYVGDIPAFASSDYFDALLTAYAWPAWTPLLSGKGDTFHHESFSLPSGKPSLWVVFWLDNGEGDFGKVDNVNVTASAVPEPSLLPLLAVAGAAGARRRRSP